MPQFDASHKKSLIAETNSEIVSKRKKRSKKIFWMFFSFFVILIATFIYLAWHQSLMIKNVYFEGNRVLSENKLKNSVNKYLSKRFILILPNRNAFIFNESDLIKSLSMDFPVIKDIEIKQGIPNDLFVRIYEREPHALWCNAISSSCVFIDTAGYAYDDAPYFSKPLFLVYELPGAEISRKVLDEKSFLFSEEIQKRITLDGVIVQRIRPKGDGIFEFNILLPDKNLVTSLITDIQLGADETVSRFRTLISSSDILENSEKILKTIDVRFGNQVIYTFY